MALDPIEFLYLVFLFGIRLSPYRFAVLSDLGSVSAHARCLVTFRSRLSMLKLTGLGIRLFFPHRSSGFSPPRCYQRFFGPESSVLPWNLPPSVPGRSGFSSSALVLWRLWPFFQRQISRASVGKTSLPPCIPPIYTAGVISEYWDSLCQACLSSLQRPFSWFAVRCIHRFCLRLPPDLPFRGVPLPCWRCPSVR